MSADNWRQCPRCARNLRHAVAAAEATAKDAYGKVSATKYHALLKLAKEKAEEELELTFREDYQIGTRHAEGDDAMRVARFSVDYSGGCTTCGFSVQHKEEAEIPLG